MSVTIRKGNLSDLDTAMQLAKDIFSPSEKELNTYFTNKLWHKNFNSNGLLLFAVADSKNIGMCFCFNKSNSLHIWLVGILEKYRKQGIWKKLNKKIVNHALERKYEKITINTYKDKFPSMYNFLIKNNFTLVKEYKGKSFFEIDV